jgi:hypothetical protein
MEDVRKRKEWHKLWAGAAWQWSWETFLRLIGLDIQPERHIFFWLNCFVVHGRQGGAADGL